ncbi:glycoside hydrolase family 6 protein [Curtobacterium sp. MCBA15_012]|uniref:glycoside hydrolase family 6 protein n=1 Tax=Curtobacterium sp. MCBA15_012 TaxID=1898738 RepID=UPI0008DCC906|nr:glycoside hydrolase family 6 protein [Curtobacterium sp. MCBA15_012]WIB01180.1 glycoside hydrolase family 6 protein [Curtobacterium sp. MCBA15_012]
MPQQGDHGRGDTGRPGGRTRGARRDSGRRQWAWIGAVALLVVAIVTAVVLVRPPDHHDDRTITARRTAAAAFPGGLAQQPVQDNQAGRREADARAAGDTSTAGRLAVIADQPVATWLTDPDETATRQVVRRVVRDARQQGRTPVFVLYAIPDRDCGSFSKGGTAERDYLPWVRSAVRAMAGSHAVVLVEPDSIAQIHVCERLGADRLHLLRQAVDELTGRGLTVYLDGGNEDRVPVATMARWLRQAGVDRVQGFATNVSNFYRVDQERAYADRLADAIGGDPHFVVDVSRNGQGWRGTWCNPEGAGLGQPPHVTRGTTRLDALLWVKTPGLSDGTCNGGPAAGQWWESYALDLVANRRQD